MKPYHARIILGSLFLSFLLPAIVLSDVWARFVPPPALEVRLNADEKAWLAQHPVLGVGGPRAFPPFSFFDQEGNAQGMAFDYLRLIFEAIGLEMRVEPGLPWPQVLDKAKAKQLDVIACAAWTEEREEFLLFSTPFLSFPLVIITRKDALFIGGLSDLQGRTVSIVKDNATQKWLERDGVAIVPHLVGTPLEALQSVSMGQADAYIENLAAATWLIEKHGLANLKVAAPMTYGNYELHLAVRNDWPELVAILDKALASFTPEQHAAIQNKWLSLRYEFGLRAADVWKWMLVVLLPALLALAVILYYNRKLRLEATERKQAEEGLKASEKRLDLAMMVKNEGIWDWNLVTNDTVFDDRYYTMAGYSPGEFPQNFKGWSEYVHPDDLANAQAAIKDYLSGLSEVFDIEFRFRRKGGSWMWIKGRGKIVERNADGTPLRMVGTHTDITERKRAEEALLLLNRDLERLVAERTAELNRKTLELEEANRHLLAMDEQRSAFITMASHELRTPLTSVLGFAKLIARDFEKHFQPVCKDHSLALKGERIRNNLAVILAEGVRLTELVNDVLDLAKMEAGNMAWRDQDIRLDEFFPKVRENAAGLFLLRPEIRFEVSLEPDLPLIHADPDRLTQVLMNLLHNSAKFTDQGLVLIEAKRGNASLRVSVRDTGIGIPADEVTNIFQKFHGSSSFHVELAPAPRLVAPAQGQQADMVDLDAHFSSWPLQKSLLELPPRVAHLPPRQRGQPPQPLGILFYP